MGHAQNATVARRDGFRTRGFGAVDVDASRVRTVAALLASVVAFACPTASAAELAVDTRIARATVYASGAALTRVGQAALPAGTTQIVIGGLPGELDEETLRFSVASPAVRLAGVEIREVVSKDYVDERERELRRKLEVLGDRRRAVADEIATAETQLRVLESLASPPAGGTARALPDGASLASLVTTVGTSAAAARTKIRDAHQRARDLDAEKAALEAALAKIKSSRKSSRELRATVETDSPVSAAVQVEYRTDSASWTWLYEARLDTRVRRLRLIRQGSVTQSSGEDWSDVELTLTTARPSDSTGTPDVQPLYATLVEPAPREPAVRRMVGAAAKSDVLEQVAVTAARRTATDYLVEYTVPGRVRVAADGEPRIYPIATAEFDVELLARTVPAQERAAFLEARFAFAQDVPFAPAQVQLYRDGALVGNATTPTWQPGAPIRLGFGIDERIRVEVLRDREGSGDRGVLGRRGVEQRRERFQVTSFHPATIPLEIVDRWPTPRDSAIDVKVDRDATPPTERDLEGRPGVILWRLQLEPRKATTVKHYYTVEYPRDRELGYSAEE